ncbi:hypothetical protein G9A89_003898, partial [Geosiphon pyriformis]
MIDFPSIEDSSVYHDNGWDNESDLEEFATGLTKAMANIIQKKKMDYRDISENTYTVMVLSKLFEPLFDNIIGVNNFWAEQESPSSKKRKNSEQEFSSKRSKKIKTQRGHKSDFILSWTSENMETELVLGEFVKPTLVDPKKYQMDRFKLARMLKDIFDGRIKELIKNGHINQQIFDIARTFKVFGIFFY